MTRIRQAMASAAALCLAGSLAPAAQGDSSGDVVRLLIECPTAAEVADITGRESTLAVGWPTPDCSYSGDAEPVSFALWDVPVDEAREGIEIPPQDGFPGQPVTDVSGWGPGAFQYGREGVWYVTYPLQDVSATLGVPLTNKDDAAALAQLFADATYPRPVPTVPPRTFTATCPAAEDVERIMGGSMEVRPTDESNTCDYVGDEHVTYSISDTFGSVAEARSDLELDFANSTVTVEDFDGLSDGAFFWVDASPFFLTWQLQDGVVAELYGGRGADETRRLARLFEDAQTGGSATPTAPPPATPGLPSTGA